MISMARNNISNLISGAVGAGAKASNNPKDVKIIQYLFNIIAAGPNLFPETGICNQDLILKIKRFQLQDLRFPVADGRIDPAGKSLKALVEKAQQKRPLRNDLNNSSQAYLFGGAWCGGSLPTEVSNIMAFLGFKSSLGLDKNSGTPHRAVVDSYLMLNSKSIPTQDNTLKKSIASSNTSSNKLTSSDYQAAATSLGSGISSAIIQAFAEVESGGRSGFGLDELPVIAFEGHIFRKYTGKKYDATHPKLSYKYVKKAGSEWLENNKNQIGMEDS